MNLNAPKKKLIKKMKMNQIKCIFVTTFFSMFTAYFLIQNIYLTTQ
jgi:hypothetical protein